MNNARNILGLDKNEEIKDNLVSKEDGMSYIRDLNKIRSKQDILLENDSLKYQLNSINIANEAVMKDTILESERLDLIKELMISENGISLENATDIMDSYIEEMSLNMDSTIKMISPVRAMINKMRNKNISLVKNFNIFSKNDREYKRIQNYYSGKDTMVSQIIGGNENIDFGTKVVKIHTNAGIPINADNAFVNEMMTFHKVKVDITLWKTEEGKKQLKRILDVSTSVLKDSKMIMELPYINGTYGKDLTCDEFIKNNERYIYKKHYKEINNEFGYLHSVVSSFERAVVVLEERGKEAANDKEYNLYVKAYTTYYMAMLKVVESLADSILHVWQCANRIIDAVK